MASLTQKALHVLKTDGVSGVIKHTKRYVKTKQESKVKSTAIKDILFINGCARELLPHPPRYRVTHQREQLECLGYTTDEIFYKSINMDFVYKYRAFVIFRCVYTPELEQFIQTAKSLNKTVFYDVDDLVIDTKYTDSISYVQKMEPSQKAQYDEDVRKMGRLLSICDAAITTTECLQEELSHYVDHVILNRNTASMEMVSLSQKVIKENHNKVKIGYFSGSITHNADFEMILPVLKDILNDYSNVELHVCGELDVPSSISSQVISHPFMDYKKLPELISQMDINLAPLQKSVFNEAKSEIKWIEASLVKVITIASKVGAFEKCIEHDQTGVLCSSLEEWKLALKKCIESKEYRDTISNQAYTYCLKHCTTMYTGYSFVSKLRQYIKKNVCFAMPKVEISGGIMVALRHMSMLQDAGVDVSILSLYDEAKFYTFMNHTFPILPLDDTKLNFHIDEGVATMWATLPYIEAIPSIKKRMYLVQNFETDFYTFEDPLKVRANQTYMPKSDIEFVTISKWCQNWLLSDYGQSSKWVANGIETKSFYSIDRNWNGKIRILIEGDCAASHKNVDESFKIVNELDPEQYEVWYMSYNSKPKDWYRIDHFMHRIPYEEVPDVYRQCHILIKTSLLESFSYPPLEMMATGGCVVVLANDGNVEYLEHEKNCLFYEKGNIKQGKEMVERIVRDENLRSTLISNGLECAKSRDWKKIQEDILNIY